MGDFELSNLNGNRLETAGRLMFGKHWISEMSEYLSVDYRRIKDWRANKRPIPDGVRLEIIDYLRKNAAAELEFADKLEKG